MKFLKITFLVLMILLSNQVYSQTIIEKNKEANQYLKIGNDLIDNSNLDSAFLFFTKASELFKGSDNKRMFLYSEQKKGFCLLKKNNFAGADSIIQSAFDKTKEFISEKDTILIEVYKNMAYIDYNTGKYNTGYDMAEISYKLSKNSEYKNDKIRMILDNTYGNLCYSKGEFNKAILLCKEGLTYAEKLFGDEDLYVAKFSNNLGVLLAQIMEIDAAMKYYRKALTIIKKIFGEKHRYVAVVYNGMANAIADKGEYDSAIEYYNKALDVVKGEKDEINSMSIDYYHNIAIANYHKYEFNLALEYFHKILPVSIKLFGEKSLKVADIYNNMGNVYDKIHDNEKALKFKFKAYELYKELMGEEHIKTANSLNNISSLYGDMKEYKKALEYQLRASKLLINLYGEDDYNAAKSNYNLASLYYKLGKYDLAIEHFNKSLNTRIKLYGEKHPDVSIVYKGMAVMYQKMGKSVLALKYIQKSLISNVKGFNDSTDLLAVPIIDNYFERNLLLESLKIKSQILSDKSANFTKITENERLKTSLLLYLAADTLINQIRQETSAKSDKIALGTKADQVYKDAVNLCFRLAESSIPGLSKKDIFELAFYFSEKNKSSVLMEALAGVEAQKFAGIPDSLLNFEKKLSVDIEFYKKQIAGGPDSINEIKYRTRLFELNRQYDKLIHLFEKDFPKYFELKYNQGSVTVTEIQKQLDKKTVIISYLLSDSSIVIYCISNNKFIMEQVLKNDNFVDKVNNFRENISNAELLQDAFINNDNRIVIEYIKDANELYNQLFPRKITKLLKGGLFSKKKNLIIVPDGQLSTIPFEALLTQEYDADWTNWENTTYFSEMPYLIKDYNISYSYSANLFYETYPKTKDKPEFQNISDWLALAPVFDNDSISGTNLRTRKLIEKNSINQSGEMNTRAWLRDGAYISPLPGSEEETKEIFNIFENNNKKAILKTHQFANEEYVKSGALKNFRFLHIATHGMVNEDKPELSCILLAQDTTSNEDNILFSGEIYNLELNADLTVLSACETGLGKIAEGEGVIGLTRALLYAGSKNIIVSLWQVSDESTNQLMVDFYKNIFEDEKKGFSEHLSKSKLKLIKEGKYAHPFFWSPFILIGK